MHFIEGENNSIFFVCANRNAQVFGGVKFDLELAKLIRCRFRNSRLPFPQTHSYSLSHTALTCTVQHLTN
jgi:hypothetical protein